MLAARHLPGNKPSNFHETSLLTTAGLRFVRLSAVARDERVFSAAGKMLGDLQKSAKDSTLAHSLFAAYNTE